MFKFSEGGEKSAILHFIACARSIRFSDNRHLKFKTIAPWYWVEPTGTVYAEPTDTTACSEGYGPLYSPNHPGKISMFSSCEVVESSAYGTGVVVDWCSARKHGMIVHSLMHKEDGLANVKVSQAAPDHWALVGGNDKPMEERLRDDDSLDSYMWGRGHCTIPPPAELIYTRQR